MVGKVEVLLAELQLQAVCQLLDSNLARNKLLACQHPSRMALLNRHGNVINYHTNATDEAEGLVPVFENLVDDPQSFTFYTPMTSAGSVFILIPSQFK